MAFNVLAELTVAQYRGAVHLQCWLNTKLTASRLTWNYARCLMMFWKLLALIKYTAARQRWYGSSNHYSTYDDIRGTESPAFSWHKMQFWEGATALSSDLTLNPHSETAGFACIYISIRRPERTLFLASTVVYHINMCMFFVRARMTLVSVQNIRRELAEKRFTAELNVDASWKFLNDVGCDATQINMDSEDGNNSLKPVSS